MFIFCTLLSNKPGFINPELTLAKQSIWACFKIIDHPENWMVSDRRNGNGWSLVHTFLQVWVLAVAIIGISIDAPCQPKSRFFCDWNVTSTWGSFLGYGWLQPGLLDSRGCWDIINRILMLESQNFLIWYGIWMHLMATPQVIYCCISYLWSTPLFCFAKLLVSHGSTLAFVDNFPTAYTCIYI